MYIQCASFCMLIVTVLTTVLVHLAGPDAAMNSSEGPEVYHNLVSASLECLYLQCTVYLILYMYMYIVHVHDCACCVKIM